MPYPNEHAARIADPSKFKSDSFRRKEIDKGITIILGKRPDRDTMETQSYRFDKSKFSPEQARQWLKDHDIKYILFEPALKESELIPESFSEVSFIPSAFKESKDPEGKIWDVVLIEAGESLNNNYYSREVLEDAIPLFEGAKAYAYEFSGMKFDHLPDETDNKGFVKNLVGWYENVRLEGNRLMASLHIYDSAGWLKGLLKEMWEKGKNLVGLSIDSEGDSMVSKTITGLKRNVEKLTKVISVDIVTEPAAGGRLARLVASVKENGKTKLTEKDAMREMMIKILREAGVEIADDIADDKLLEMFKSCMMEAEKKKEAAAENEKKKLEEADAEKKKIEQEIEAGKATFKGIEEEVKEGTKKMDERTDGLEKRLCEYALKDALRDSSLPVPVTDSIKKKYSGRIFKESELQSEIVGWKDTLAKITPELISKSAGNQSRASVEKDESEKVSQMFDDFFDKKIMSFKECYIQSTGDKRVSGLLKEATKMRSLGRLKESAILGSTWAEILGDSITRRMLKDYKTEIDFASWKKIVDIVPVFDFRTNRRQRMGGFNNLPAVGASGTYADLTNPTDEEATYSATKRGGTCTISLEAIKNDDVGSIRRIPGKLSSAALQTVHEFVFDFFTANSGNGAVIYDGETLFETATHANRGTTAFSHTELVNVRVSMAKRTDMTNSKRLGLKPRYLIVPLELESSAYTVLNTKTVTTTAGQLDLSIVANRYGMDPNPIVVEYWTDTNNWYVCTSPDNSPTIELGFLDGKEDPELFVADAPTVGSMFTADEIVYKIRHIYGGAVMDYRSFYGEIVA